jgi:hypothetical protein
VFTAGFCEHLTEGERVTFSLTFRKVFTMLATTPQLRTPGRLAAELGVPLHRVLHILATRKHIAPTARAGTLRLFDADAAAQVRHEVNGQDARRAGKGVAHA